MKPYVFIATPCHEMKLPVRYVQSLFSTDSFLRQPIWKDGEEKVSIPYYVSLQTGAEPDRARNYLVAEFMANLEYTHICFIDSDQGWPKDTIPKLLARGVDLVGVPIAKKVEGPTQWNLIAHEPPLWDGKLLHMQDRRDGIGTGILMASRHCIEKMLAAYPELRITRKPKELKEGGENYFSALFQRVVQDGEYVGEDITFCRRWQAIGGKVYADPSIEAIHVGQKEWKAKFADSMTFEAIPDEEAVPA